MRGETRAAPGKSGRTLSAMTGGLLRKNTVLSGGLVISPIVFAATNGRNALMLSFAFTAITFVAVLIGSFIPRKLVYTLRIILYTMIAAAVYIPAMMTLELYFPDARTSLGIFLPLLITNALIVSKTESRFYRQGKAEMLMDVVMYILGFDAAALLVGILRELLANGTFFGIAVTLRANLPVLAYPFGGFLLLGLLAALHRVLVSGWSQDKDREEEA